MFVTALYDVNSAMAPSYSFSIIFACEAERGVMSHWNGNGVELKPSEYAKLDQSEPHAPGISGIGYTYMSTSISFPSLSFAGCMLKPHSMRAMLMDTDAAPRCIPGHTRRPQPKAL